MMQTEPTLAWFRDGKALPPAERVPWAQPGMGRSEAPGSGGGDVELHLTIPLDEINGIWTPYGDRSALQKLVWTGRVQAGPMSQPALLAFVDRDLHSRFVFLAEPADHEATVAWQLDQAGGAYHVTVAWTPTGAPFTPGVRFSTARRPVHAVARELFEPVASEPAPGRPARCYEPSYCTWYAFHGALEQKPVEACAKLAAELGFGTFILDDGWMYDTMQRVQGPIGPWFRLHGDYTPSPRKFPDFAGHVQYVKSLGMRFMLWAAPFTVGVDSQARKKLEGHLLTSWMDEGFLVADPRSSAVVAHLEETFARLVRDYPVDGFKVDYDYALVGPGRKPFGIGPAYREAVRRIIAAVRGVNPAIEWNLMPNGCTLGLTEAFRCADVPFDPETNRLYMANFKAVVGNRVLHYDPALWRPDASLATVHRHLVPALFCIPSVGADLPSLPPAHREALRDWLGFYRRHQALLNGGEFEPVWAAGDYQSFRTTLSGRRIEATFSAYPVQVGDVPRTLLINAGGSAQVNLAVTAKVTVQGEDSRGGSRWPARALAPGLQAVSCPSGGVLRIEQE